MANIARLGVVLGLQTAEFTTGIESAKRQTKDLQSTLEGLKTAFEALAVAETARQLLEFADKISDTADAYEMTIANVLDLSEALAQSGGDAENAGKLLGTFTKQVNEAANGSKAAQDAFTSIGISLKDIGSLPMDKLFDKTLEGLSKISDPIKRNATAFELMGKAIRGVDLTKLSDEMLHGAGATDHQTEAIRKLGDAHDQLDNALFKTKLLLAQVFSDALKTAEVNFGGFGDTVQRVGELIAKAFEGAAFGVGVVVETVKMGVAAVNNVIKSLVPGGASLADLNAATAQKFLDNVKSLAAVGTGKDQKQDSIDGNKRKVEAAKNTQLDQLLKELATLELVSKKYENSLIQQEKSIQLKTQQIAMTQNEAEIAQVLFELEKKRADQVAQLQEKKQLAIDTGADKKVIDAIQAQIDKVNELTETYKSQMVDLTVAYQDFSQSYLGGLFASYKEFQSISVNNAKVIQDSVSSVFNNMSNALATFVTTGKMNFKDLARSIIQDLIRIQLQAQMTKIFSSLLGSFTGALGGATDSSGFATNAAGETLSFASGGEPPVGVPSLVGENGPELFIPKSAGTIIPNNQTNTLLGNNQPQIVYNGPYIANLSAIDTQSAMQFISNNKMAVYAANMSASRSIPTSVR